MKFWIQFAICFCFSTTWANEQYQSHASIIKTVEQYLDSHLNSSPELETRTQIGHLDKRLILTKCDKALKPFSNNHRDFGSRVSVGVKCTGSKPWSLYVPVTIQRIAPIYVASHPISKGEKISDRDIQKVFKDVNKLHGRYNRTKEEIIGKIAKRSISLGSVFNPRYLALPIVIKKGDKVDIIAKLQGLSIRMSGKAENDGAQGQTINVKNLSSKRIVEAVVQHAGLVKINL